jgi:SNF2 family DNA or RNA helicase
VKEAFKFYVIREGEKVMRYKPHAYQSYCINRLIANPVQALFLDMGLGKTVITLTVANDLKYNRFAVNKILVIAPKKVAEATWSKEAAKWDHLKILRVTPVLGPLTKRIKALNTPSDIFVINRENVPWLVEYYRNTWPFDMVVVDEFSSFKNHSAKRFKSLTWVRQHITRFVGLTGTPAPNGLLDLWAQVYLLDGGQRLEKYISRFREKYFETDQRDRDRVFTYALKPGAEEVIRDKISDICVSMKAEDYLELPDCTTVTVSVVFDKKAKAAYEKLEK